jgi:SPX domain protein involved in polyphosphate accumulation
MRLEYKYLVANSELKKLRNYLKPYVVSDQYGDGNVIKEYTVRSIYFDSTNLDCFHEKIEGISVRKKIRIRGYNEQDNQSVIFLEIKRKRENVIDKNRSALKYHDLGELMRTGDLEEFVLTENGFDNSIEDGTKFFHGIKRNALKPIVLVVYEREAYFSKFSSLLRITLDKNLRYLEFPSLDKLYYESDLTTALTNHFILEIKFSEGFPGWLTNIINKLNLVRRAVSKYTICLESQRFLNPHKRISALPFIESDFGDLY